MDVHGAGAQRSDPKDGNASDYPAYHGPQGDVQYVFNYCRCVRYNQAYNPTTGTIQLEEGSSSLLVYPNPVRDELYISFEDRSHTSLRIKLYSTVGQCLLEKEVSESGDITLNLGGLSKGVYILHLQDESGYTYSRKIIKQ